MLRSIRVGLAVLASFVLLSCGGGGGGGGSTTPTPAPGGGSTTTGGSPGGTSTGTGSTPPTFSGFDFSLAQGDYWRFSWDALRSSFAQGSSGSSDSETGTFEVKLGAPATVAGVTMYRVQLAGNPAAVVNSTAITFAPRWQYLGMDSLKLVGSTDGVTASTIFDAQTGRWGGGGFFTTFGATTLVQASSSSLTNTYISEPAAVRAGQSSSRTQCETILGIQICGDSSQTFTNNEYYKAGVGPIGYDLLNNFSFCGGGFCSGGSHDYNVGLIASSRRGDTVASALEIEPNNTVAQAMLLTLPATVDGAALNETAYGGATIVPTEVESNDSFTSAQSVTLPIWIAGTVRDGDTGTSVGIPAFSGVAAYTATFEDFYKFTAVASANVNVLLNFPNTGANLDLYVFTLAGQTPTIINRAIRNNVQLNSFTEFAAFAATAGTTYYIAVDGFSAANRAPYELFIYNTTQPASRGVVDWFKVELATTRALTINVSGGASIMVTNADATTLLASATPATQGGSASLTTNSLTAGTYLIGLTAGGAYRLIVD